MIKNFLILNCIGKNDKVGIKINNKFFIHDFNKKVNNDQLLKSLLNIIQKHKVKFDKDFSIFVNNGPGSFSTTRVSIAIAKGIKISKKINIFGYKNSDLGEFSLNNVELLIKKNLMQKNLIKPIYIS